MTRYRIVKRIAVALNLLLLIVFMCSESRASIAYRTVALSGETAPGSSAVFRSFGGVIINNVGNVALRGSLLDEFGFTVEGVWAESQGELVYFASEGDPAPGYDPGIRYRSIGVPHMDDAGRVTFSAWVRGRDSGNDLINDHGIWLYSNESSSVVMFGGQPVPGLPGVTFNNWLEPKISASGKITIAAITQGNVTDLTNSGFWTKEAGPLQSVILEGQAAPGTSPGTVFGAEGSRNAFQYFLTNNNGQLLFLAELLGNDVNSLNNRGLWVEVNGSFRLVAREGDSVPGLPASIVFGDQYDSAFLFPAFNDNGRVAFKSTYTLAGNNTARSHGVWSEGGGTLHLVARQGGRPPDMESGVVFDGFTDVNINNAGQTAFFGQLSGTGIFDSNDSGLWMETGGVLELVIREGMRAPGTPEGVNFGLAFSPLFNTFNDSIINDLGQIAFEGSLFGQGVNEANDRGIWATRPDGQMVIIAREGDIYDANDDPLIQDLRTIEQINLDGSFNNASQLVFRLYFTDGSEGVFVATIPEPGASGLVGLGLLSLIRRQVRPS